MSAASSSVKPVRVVVEADGGARGNPGPAAYGALLRDADTGSLLGESAATIGRTTNNVAEYRGLIAGLELAREHAPDARLEVRMDSKLVVEQMAGRWKVKHPDLRPLAVQARRLAPPDVSWTWVPRADNSRADALVNAVLDGRWSPTPHPRTSSDAPPMGPAMHDVSRGTPTTLLLLRHGTTQSTERRLFCGRGGSDPELTQQGRAEAERAAVWLARRGDVGGVVSSPQRRARETAAAAGATLGVEVTCDDDLAELAFGDWDGLDLASVRERWPAELGRWFADPDQAPPGGESLTALAARVDRAVDRALVAYEKQTVVLVCHATPIKSVVRRVLAAPPEVVHRMQLAPGSVSQVRWWPDGAAVLGTFAALPE